MERITLEQAIAIINQSTFPIKHTKQLPLSCCLGKILSASITAPISVPPFDRSPYDGYGVLAEDISLASYTNPVSLSIIDSIMAGDDSSHLVLHSGEAVQVMTGAMLPKGVNCVIPQELTNLDDTAISIYQPGTIGENICKKGEDIAKDSLILKAGTKLNASSIGVLASLGYEKVSVFSTPSVALISTGNELVPAGNPLSIGKIFDTNLPYLQARLNELGITPAIFSVGDSPAQLNHILYETASHFDFILTTGGVSVGQKDMMPMVLKRLSAPILFHGLFIKPGSPALFSALKKKPILCLSGNPFAAAATFELLARPILAQLTLDSSFSLKKVTGTLVSPFPKSSKIRRFIRGYYNYETKTISIPNNGEGHGSSQFSVSLYSNCLLDIPENSPPLLPQTLADAFLL